MITGSVTGKRAVLLALACVLYLVSSSLILFLFLYRFGVLGNTWNMIVHVFVPDNYFLPIRRMRSGLSLMIYESKLIPPRI